MLFIRKEIIRVRWNTRYVELFRFATKKAIDNLFPLYFLSTMSEPTPIEFNSTQQEVSIGKDQNSFLHEILLSNDICDNTLKAFNAILFQDDELKLNADNNKFDNDNILKEKVNIEIFSNTLKALEEEGEILDPIFVGPNLDPSCEPMVVTIDHLQPINLPNSVQQDTDDSDDGKLEDFGILSISCGNHVSTSEKNVPCSQIVDCTPVNYSSVYFRLQKYLNGISGALKSIEKTRNPVLKFFKEAIILIKKSAQEKDQRMIKNIMRGHKSYGSSLEIIGGNKAIVCLQHIVSNLGSEIKFVVVISLLLCIACLNKSVLPTKDVKFREKIYLLN